MGIIPQHRHRVLSRQRFAVYCERPVLIVAAGLDAPRSENLSAADFDRELVLILHVSLLQAAARAMFSSLEITVAGLADDDIRTHPG